MKDLKYYIVTELEKQSIWYDTLDEAISAAEQTLPANMAWEVREEDDEAGTEEVVFTHYEEANKMNPISVTETRRINEDTYDWIGYSITLDGAEIGTASVISSEGSPAYIERIDIDEDQRNHGYGSAAINMLSDIYGGIIIAPDNEDAQRLYDRLGREYHGEVADYLDQGYGVYMI